MDKNKKGNHVCSEHYEVVDIDSFSEMQLQTFNIINTYFNSTLSNKKLILLIVAIAGTGKSW